MIFKFDNRSVLKNMEKWGYLHYLTTLRRNCPYMVMLKVRISFYKHIRACTHTHTPTGKCHSEKKKLYCYSSTESDKSKNVRCVLIYSSKQIKTICMSIKKRMSKWWCLCTMEILVVLKQMNYSHMFAAASVWNTSVVRLLDIFRPPGSYGALVAVLSKRT